MATGECPGMGFRRKHSLCAICNAIRYVQGTGGQWRMLPQGFPPWHAVYITFWRWRKSGRWKQIAGKLNPHYSIGFSAANRTTLTGRGAKSGFAIGSS